MLGNQYGVEAPNLGTLRGLGQVAEATYSKLLREDRRKANSIAKYFLDIDQAVAKCARILNQEGVSCHYYW